MHTDHIPEHIRQAAVKLGQNALTHATLIRAGGNNQIWRLTSAQLNCILKLYPQQNTDVRDRLDTEWNALSFLAAQKLDTVPKPLARHAQTALYEYIPGEKILDANPDDITQMAAFFLSLQAFRPQAQQIAPASAACFSTADALQQLQSRYHKLIGVATAYPALRDFLQAELAPLAAKFSKFPSYSSLPAGLQALSPSDFGLHNAIRRPNGRLVFVDFEYFGWDDPVKATADVAWHAGMELAEPLSKQFQRQMIDFFSETDRHFAQRLQDMLPIYGLIWCLIMLNEFIPEVWERRCISGRASDTEHADVLRNRQLVRARRQLEKICLLL